MLVKIHESIRKIVAICDSELLGRKFEDDKRQIEVNEQFYSGDKKSELEVLEIIKDAAEEDAAFNIVGERAVKVALKVGIINKEGIIKIQGIPHALVLS